MAYTNQIGPEHPDYHRAMTAERLSAKPDPVKPRIFGAVAVVGGLACGWWNWHLLLTQHYFYMKLGLLGPLAVFGGLLMAWKPKWSGPITKDSTKAHKTAMFGTIALVAVVTLINVYLMETYRP